MSPLSKGILLRPVINLGKVFDGTHEQGAHAWYKEVLPSLGVKVFQASRDFTRARREFIITKYLEPSGFTTTAYALGEVSVVSPRSNRVLVRSCIWMEHIPGPTIQDVLDTVIYNFCPISIIAKPVEVKEKWAYQSEYFTPVRLHLERTVKAIHDGFGIECCDHNDNLSNFILQPSGLIRVIDFSIESIPKDLKEVIYKQTEQYLSVELPDRFISELKRYT